MTPTSDHDHDVQHGARPGSEPERTQELAPEDQTRPTPTVSWFGPDDEGRPAAAPAGAGGSGAPQGGSGSAGASPYGQDQYGQNQYGQDQYGRDPYGQPQYAQGQYGQAPYGQSQYGAGQYAGGQSSGYYAYPTDYAQPYGSGDTATTSAFGGGGRDESRKDRRPRRRWVDMALAAVVAAVVAGGTTAGVLAADNSSQPATATSSASRPAGTGAGPVAQGRSGSAIDWGAVASAVEPSVVAISVSSQAGGGEGSGVILDDQGRVLTNNHVATAGGQGGSLTVTLSDGRTYDATIVGTDPSTDLAVIQMKGATNLKPATLGDSAAVKVGASVMAVGNPLGLAGTVTTGIVSALDRPVTTSNEDQTGSADPVVTNAIQTDAAVNPGNSGGALVDSSGRVIGIPSSIASLGQSGAGGQSGSIGLGFSIPINEAKSIADQLIKNGRAEHPFLGVTLNDGKVQQGSASRSAAVVQTVSSGTPAASAGLQQGDAITAVNGDLVNGSESLVAQIREKSVGDKVELTVSRGGKERKVNVTLTSRPSGQ
jgi:putative serine protease PepD